MDIKQAIERVAGMNHKVEKLDEALAMVEKLDSYGGQREVSAQVYVGNHGTETVILNRDAAIELLRGTKAHYEAEIARLQPVIDMANAALKGIGA